MHDCSQPSKRSQEKGRHQETVGRYTGFCLIGGVLDSLLLHDIQALQFVAKENQLSSLEFAGWVDRSVQANSILEKQETQ